MNERFEPDIKERIATIADNGKGGTIELNLGSAERRHFVDSAAIEARNAYRRKWYRENKDKVKAQQERYWIRKAAQLTAKDAAQKDAQKGTTKA